MINLPIQFADWQTACILQADKASAAVGPSAAAGLGAASFEAFVSHLQAQEDIAQFELVAAMRQVLGTKEAKAQRVADAHNRLQQIIAALAACDEYQAGEFA